MSDQQNLISQFIEITGVEETRAKFYLESSGWDLNVSSNLYYVIYKKKNQVIISSSSMQRGGICWHKYSSKTFLEIGSLVN